MFYIIYLAAQIGLVHFMQNIQANHMKALDHSLLALFSIWSIKWSDPHILNEDIFHTDFQEGLILKKAFKVLDNVIVKLEYVHKQIQVQVCSLRNVLNYVVLNMDSS